jgi:hypothetical protein
MSEASVGPVEGWPDDSLRQTVDGSYGLGSDAGLPLQIRFLIGVVRLIRIRQEKIAAEPDTQHGEDLPAVFFFSPQLPDSLEAFQLQRSPMLNNGLTPLGDRFWFVGPLGNYGRALDLQGWSDDAEVFDRAGELGIDGLPAVLLDNRHDPVELRHFPKGLGDPEIAEVVSLGGRDISIEEVLGHVRRAHETNMKTPKLIPRDLKLWENASKHRPVEQAEKRIQTILRIALAGAMPATVIHEEPNIPAGRIDLEIQEYRGVGVVISHALLELKVLRSYGSTGKPVSAAEVEEVITEGISQAAAYRDDHETKAAALCCFDMRKSESGEQCFAAVREPAEEKKVALGVYYLFASARRSRPKVKAVS